MPPKVQINANISKLDMEKRSQIFLELIYYIFDSILIPLIRSNFHVTESNQHRNRLFYFRHDVWRALTEPSVDYMKSSMFSELKLVYANRALNTRKLSSSHIRLLPKGPGVRPIMNLRRRITKLQNGKAVLGRSINAELAPVQRMLDYEKMQQPSRLESSLFSVGDLHVKLKDYQSRQLLNGKTDKHFFFAKVDVKSCFDTIPQERVVSLMAQLASQKDYHLANYVEVNAPDPKCYPLQPNAIPKANRKFCKKMKSAYDQQSFEEVVNQDLAKNRRGAVFVEKTAPICFSAEKLLYLVEQHVKNNCFKIGKKIFRQKQGIPQGSVVSSLLCSFFYADFESRHLERFHQSESILLRLIDDFLLITTNRYHAEYFLQVMHHGNEEYGIKVNPAKSLVNFEVSIDGYELAKASTTEFAYCGTSINTRTLELTRDRERRKGVGTFSSHGMH